MGFESDYIKIQSPAAPPASLSVKVCSFGCVLPCSSCIWIDAQSKKSAALSAHGGLTRYWINTSDTLEPHWLWSTLKWRLWSFAARPTSLEQSSTVNLVLRTYDRLQRRKILVRQAESWRWLALLWEYCPSLMHSVFLDERHSVGFSWGMCVWAFWKPS